MNENSKRFLSALKTMAGIQKRVYWETIITCFKKTFPLDYAENSSDSLRFLRTILDEMSNENAIRLPVNRRHWDSSQEPRLPLWIIIESNLPNRNKEEWWKTFPWHPKLQWASSLERVDQSLGRELKVINTFLKNYDKWGSNNCIPIKERSLLLFKDEKRLDSLFKGQLFKKGRLTLEMLDCFRTWEPFTVEHFSSLNLHRTLIIENKDTYYSVFKICSELKHASPYRHVIYGCGIKIYSTIFGIENLDPKISEIEYFGDIDPKGLEIPCITQKKLIEARFPQRILPALPLYRRAFELIELSKISFKITRERAKKWNDNYLSFLPEPLQSKAKTLFQQSFRIPQEITNYMELSQILKKK